MNIYLDRKLFGFGRSGEGFFILDYFNIDIALIASFISYNIIFHYIK
jgi:hypothetical protein